jgi:glycosyltransferase involved in cell wall biosynthesis
MDRKPPRAPSSAPLKILMVIPGLPMGGAEIFFVRLAKGLNRNNQVFIYILSTWATDPFLMSELSGLHVKFPPFSGRAVFRYINKVSLILKRFLRGFDLVDAVRTWSLRRLHRRYSFSVINPHLLAAERQVCLAFEKTPVPIVGTDHGDYRWVINDDNRSHFDPIFRRSDALVCLSESNIEICQRYPRPNGFEFIKIYNGYEFSGSAIESVDDAANHDRVQEFVFGLVGRGIPEKGWREALAAFIELRNQVTAPIRLIFVGEGEHLRSLQKNVPVEIEDQDCCLPITKQRACRM